MEFFREFWIDYSAGNADVIYSDGRESLNEAVFTDLSPLFDTKSINSGKSSWFDAPLFTRASNQDGEIINAANKTRASNKAR